MPAWCDSTQAIRKQVIDHEQLRVQCDKVNARGAPATTVDVRDIVKQVYAFANLTGNGTPTRPTM
jgi:hypothetical protein